MKNDRRHFLRVAAALPALGALGAFAPKTQAADGAPSDNAPGEKAKFQLGVASYSFHRFDRVKALEMTHRAGLKNLCIKDVHLKLKIRLRKNAKPPWKSATKRTSLPTLAA